MIELKDVTVKAGKFILKDINLTIPSGRYGMLIGKTGSGKTTILETVCGLKKVAAGSIFINGVDVTHLRPAERGIGFVPQDGALFETKTVFENIVFSLRLRRWTKAEQRARVAELAAMLKIEHLLNRSVYFLSGGEKQRIALARALAFSPNILCLDEPLSALDTETHHETCLLLKKMQQIIGITVIHITHNRQEVRMLADICYEITAQTVSKANLTEIN